MTGKRRDRGRGRGGAITAALVLVGLGLLAGCSSTKKPDKLTDELLSSPKETLFEKGKALLARKKYDLGRKYLNFVFETYPNDPQGREALLLVADSYFRQGGSTSYTEARFRYRDYLNRYPGAPQRDYARYQYAFCYDKEHEKPDRDQTSTRQAMDQYRSLMQEFPGSGYSAAARERMRMLADLLAEHEIAIAIFYINKGAPAAALGRLTVLEERFPEYRSKDKVLFYSAQALHQLGRDQEAARYYSRLIEEFPASALARKAKGKLGKTKLQTLPSVDTPPRNE